MRDPALSVHIDRIVLTGLEVTPDRAEGIRTQVEAGVLHELQREGPRQGLGGGHVNRLQSPELHLTRPHTDSSVAGAVAGSISHALRDAGLRGSR